MATDAVLHVPAVSVGRLENGLEIEVHTSGGKLGTLWISKGTIEWRPPYAKAKPGPYSFSWVQFDKAIRRSRDEQ